MSAVAVRPASRFWFRADALVTGANALLYLALHQVLPAVLGAGRGLYLAAGAVLLVVTIGLSVVAMASARPRVLPETLAVINVVWALGSFAVAITNPFTLTTAGLVWTVLQGVVVLGFAVLQLRALRAD